FFMLEMAANRAIRAENEQLQQQLREVNAQPQNLQAEFQQHRIVESARLAAQNPNGNVMAYKS
ncbi:hypothetical protein FRX31_017489, partial [Thalictrum thalictroides]